MSQNNVEITESNEITLNVSQDVDVVNLTLTQSIVSVNVETAPTNISLQVSNVGTKGDSAYQIWLNNGNEGTEQDFLDSLRQYPYEITIGPIPPENPQLHDLWIDTNL